MATTDASVSVAKSIPLKPQATAHVWVTGERCRTDEEGYCKATATILKLAHTKKNEDSGTNLTGKWEISALEQFINYHLARGTLLRLGEGLEIILGKDERGKEVVVRHAWKNGKELIRTFSDEHSPLNQRYNEAYKKYLQLHQLVKIKETRPLDKGLERLQRDAKQAFNNNIFRLDHSQAAELNNIQEKLHIAFHHEDLRVVRSSKEEINARPFEPLLQSLREPAQTSSAPEVKGKPLKL